MLKSLYFAPLQSYTTVFYRMAFSSQIGGVDKYFTPFFEKGHKRVYQPMLEPELNAAYNSSMQVIPQVLTDSSEFLIDFSSDVKKLGYNEINLNMGCPYSPVVKKGLGGGLLSKPEKVDELLDAFFSSREHGKLSVKMRLGISDSDEWEPIINVLNKYPLEEIIVHPRTVKQQYKGTPDWEMFGHIVEQSKIPLVGNGDMLNVEVFKGLQAQFPSINSWMIGRGILTNPLLPLLIRGEKFTSIEFKNRCKLFYNQFRSVVELEVHDVNVKRNLYNSFFFYLSDAFENGARIERKLSKAVITDKYALLVYEFFNLSVNRHVVIDLCD